MGRAAIPEGCRLRAVPGPVGALSPAESGGDTAVMDGLAAGGTDRIGPTCVCRWCGSAIMAR